MRKDLRQLLSHTGWHHEEKLLRALHELVEDAAVNRGSFARANRNFTLESLLFILILRGGESVLFSDISPSWDNVRKMAVAVTQSMWNSSLAESLLGGAKATCKPDNSRRQVDRRERPDPPRPRVSTIAATHFAVQHYRTLPSPENLRSAPHGTSGLAGTWQRRSSCFANSAGPST